MTQTEGEFQGAANPNSQALLLLMQLLVMLKETHGSNCNTSAKTVEHCIALGQTPSGPTNQWHIARKSAQSVIQDVSSITELQTKAQLHGCATRQTHNQ